MFLLRTAFWLTILLLILPTDKAEQQSVYGVAKTAAHDIQTFCVRNPNVCEKGRAAFEKLSAKAEFGAKMLVDIVSKNDTTQNEQSARSHSGVLPTHPERSSGPNYKYPSISPGKEKHPNTAQNTLTPSDLGPAWSS